MSLAQSIAAALSGRRTGDGWVVPTVCHGGDGFNLQISDNPDGTMRVYCHSHGCTHKTIMQTFEDMGLKPKTEFNGKQRQAFIQKKTRRQLMESLFFESHILLQYLNDRAGDIAKAGDSNYLKLHPEFQKMPDQPFERELEAAKQTKKIIGQLYGI